MENYDVLKHYGILGQKWGVRRYQNEDGSLTSAGKDRYSDGNEGTKTSGGKKAAKREYKAAKQDARLKRNAAYTKADEDYEKALSRKQQALDDNDREYSKKEKDINSYYDSEVEKHRTVYEETKEEMTYFEPGSFIYKDVERKYNAANEAISDLETRRAGAIYANKVAKDQAAIKINAQYEGTSLKAEEEHKAACEKAGKDYVSAIQEAKRVYRQNKK